MHKLPEGLTTWVFYHSFLFLYQFFFFFFFFNQLDREGRVHDLYFFFGVLQNL